jgi:hypothetical protein
MDIAKKLQAIAEMAAAIAAQIAEQGVVSDEAKAGIAALVSELKSCLEVKEEVKEKKARDVKPIIIMNAASGQPMKNAPVVTSMAAAVSWAKKQSGEQGGVNQLVFMRQLGTFKAQEQKVMKYEIE